MKLTKTQIIFIIYLAALGAFAPFSTDIYLASMPTIQYYFHTSAENIQLTLSLFFVSFAFSLLFWGPLSDRIGRKRVILIGVGIFILGSLLCAISHTISELIVARIIQAIGACSGIVIALAIVRDTFNEQNQMSKILSIILSVTMLAPMIAPIIGSYLLVHIGWRSNFYFLSIYGLIVFIGAFILKETHPKMIRKILPVRNLLNAYIKQMSNLPFALAVFAVGTNFAVLFSFISSSPFIYIDIYKLATHLFGYFFALNAFALMCGSLSLNRLKAKFSDRGIIKIALVITAISAIVMLISIDWWQHSIWSVAIPSFMVTYGMGILYPELTSYALKNVVAYTGLASSLIGAIRFILAAIIAFIIGIVITKSAISLAIIMLILTILTTFSMICYFRITVNKKA